MGAGAYEVGHFAKEAIGLGSPFALMFAESVEEQRAEKVQVEPILAPLTTLRQLGPLPPPA